MDTTRGKDSIRWKVGRALNWLRPARVAVLLVMALGASIWVLLEMFGEATYEFWNWDAQSWQAVATASTGLALAFLALFTYQRQTRERQAAASRELLKDGLSIFALEEGWIYDANDWAGITLSTAPFAIQLEKVEIRALLDQAVRAVQSREWHPKQVARAITMDLIGVSMVALEELASTRLKDKRTRLEVTSSKPKGSATREADPPRLLLLLCDRLGACGSAGMGESNEATTDESPIVSETENVSPCHCRRCASDGE